MPFLIANLEVDVSLLSFFENHNIFIQDVVEEIQVSVQGVKYRCRLIMCCYAVS